MFRRLKTYRRIFTRLEKPDLMYVGLINFVLVVDGLRGSCEHAMVWWRSKWHCARLGCTVRRPASVFVKMRAGPVAPADLLAQG